MPFMLRAHVACACVCDMCHGRKNVPAGNVSVDTVACGRNDDGQSSEDVQDTCERVTLNMAHAHPVSNPQTVHACRTQARPKCRTRQAESNAIGSWGWGKRTNYPSA